MLPLKFIVFIVKIGKFVATLKCQEMSEVLTFTANAVTAELTDVSERDMSFVAWEGLTEESVTLYRIAT
jgi:hypothetical protein